MTGQTDIRLGRDVALKVLPPAVGRDPERLARFQREAKALAALDHPGIVTVYSVEEAQSADGNVHFLTMQLIEGQSLAELLQSGHPEAESGSSRLRASDSAAGRGAPRGLKIDRIIDIAIRVADALAAAHEKGIVHRDLKLVNVPIFLALEPRLKVALLQLGGLLVTSIHDTPRPPEIEGLHYAPRVTQPVLMMNGRNDAIFPYESSQVPLFQILGTPPQHKQHLTFPGGHSSFGWQNELIKESLNWLDRWFGPVEK